MWGRWRERGRHHHASHNNGGRERRRPVLLTVTERGRPVVAQACGLAQRCGVQQGMSVAQARALLPEGVEVVVEAHRPERDAAALGALARWAVRFTPMVQVDPPDGLLLEITGCEHLYGGTRGMVRAVTGQLRGLGLTVHAAVGPTVGSAWALARYGRAGTMVELLEEVEEALRPLPVRALRIERAVEQSLRAVAVETVGQMMALRRRAI